jgi:hypothetical protein
MDVYDVKLSNILIQIPSQSVSNKILLDRTLTCSDAHPIPNPTKAPQIKDISTLSHHPHIIPRCHRLQFLLQRSGYFQAVDKGMTASKSD